MGVMAAGFLLLSGLGYGLGRWSAGELGHSAKEGRMGDAGPPIIRPWWVRAVLPPRTSRSAARSRLGVCALLGWVGLLIAVTESVRGTLLGGIAVPVGLAGGVLGLAGAIWCWLAARWVNRNATWGAPISGRESQ